MLFERRRSGGEWKHPFIRIIHGWQEIYSNSSEALNIHTELLRTRCVRCNNSIEFMSKNMLVLSWCISRTILIANSNSFNQLTVLINLQKKFLQPRFNTAGRCAFVPDYPLRQAMQPSTGNAYTMITWCAHERPRSSTLTYSRILRSKDTGWHVQDRRMDLVFMLSLNEDLQPLSTIVRAAVRSAALQREPHAVNLLYCTSHANVPWSAVC